MARRAIAVAALTLVVGGALAARALTHAGQAVYGIPGWARLLVIGLLVAIVAGSALIAWSRQAGYPAGLLAIAALVAFGVVTIFSIGLPALLLAMALIPLLASRRWPQERRGAATAGAVLVGVALPLLALCALSGPVVSCGSDSVSGGENVFMGLMSGDSTSEMSSGSDGSSGGHASGGGYEYSFECRDGELASFRLRWR